LIQAWLTTAINLLVLSRNYPQHHNTWSVRLRSIRLTCFSNTGGLRQAPLNPVAQGPQVNPDVFTKTLAEQNPLEQAYDTASSYLSPNRPGIQPPTTQQAIQQVKQQYAGLNLSPAEIATRADALVAKQTPGFFTKYGPLAATGIGALALTGNLSSPFEAPEQEPGESYEAIWLEEMLLLPNSVKNVLSFLALSLHPQTKASCQLNPRTLFSLL
jgi:hypothetical protein